MGLTILFRSGVRLNAVRLGLAGALVVSAVACTVSTSATDSPYWIESDGGALEPDDAGAVGSTTLLATVDPNVTMNATPGQGVGIFTQYDTGGHWHIWWTCDTAITNELCAVHVKVTVATGAITGVSADHFAAGDTLTTPSTPASGAEGAILAQTTTTLTTQGVFFDTDPGATITLWGAIGGVYSGQFLFWVEAGKINDGYTGLVSDPLQLKGASP